MIEIVANHLESIGKLFRAFLSDEKIGCNRKDDIRPSKSVSATHILMNYTHTYIYKKENKFTACMTLLNKTNDNNNKKK